MIDRDHAFETSVRDLIMDICEVMYRRGYSAVSIGAIMRLLGSDTAVAQQHDDEYFALDDGFAQIAQSRRALETERVPPGATIH